MCVSGRGSGGQGGMECRATAQLRKGACGRGGGGARAGLERRLGIGDGERGNRQQGGRAGGQASERATPQSTAMQNPNPMAMSRDCCVTKAVYMASDGYTVTWNGGPPGGSENAALPE